MRGRSMILKADLDSKFSLVAFISIHDLESRISSVRGTQIYDLKTELQKQKYTQAINNYNIGDFCVKQYFVMFFLCLFLLTSTHRGPINVIPYIYTKDVGTK